MNWRIWLITSVLIFTGAAPVYYKTQVLNFDFIPRVRLNIWDIEFRARPTPDGKLRRIVVPVARTDGRVKVEDIRREDRGFQFQQVSSEGGARAVWTGKTTEKINLQYRFKVTAQAEDFGFPRRVRAGTTDPALKPYLRLDALPTEVDKTLSELESNIIMDRKYTDEVVRAIYYYLTEEYLDTKKKTSLSEAVMEGRADSRTKSEVFRILCRRNGVPARTVMGLFLTPGKTQGERRRVNPVFWNEVYLNERWYPVNTSKDLLGQLGEEYIPLSRDPFFINDWPGKEFRFRAYGQLSLGQIFDPAEYRRVMHQKNSFFARYSLFLLPLSTQYMFRILLLLPLGSLVLAFFRNFIGIRTFGIFLPVLLALFFTESSLSFGLFFFLIVIAVSLILRRYLTQLHLLAVPRLGIMLTFVLVFLAVFSVMNQEWRVFSGYKPNLFPVIITTVFVERFNIMLDEQGVNNTLRVLLGTFAIAIIAYFILSFETLQLMIFAHPEFLFIIAAILLLAGRYNGYRLAELFRFRAVNQAAVTKNSIGPGSGQGGNTAP